MWNLSPAWDDEEALARVFRAAAPFPHLVFDDFVDQAALDDLLAALEEEPVDDCQGDIFWFEGSSPEPRTDAFRRLRDSFAEALAPRLSRISGKALSRADMRAYAYRPGHYLLPHNDHQQHVGRVLAYAYYLPSPEPPEGGELELFRCTMDGRDVVRTESAKIIAPVPNRLVVFEVSDASLHQVREVMAGLRASLAGWFYP
ncbi:hypothetical protein AKJ09_07262 [Labilithrix luteola]|uniref:Fe2OG dioxygenase domain-containing protein n=1 Tax=Labilithrix luteola TaxID=1391654 RepID=A0A0K1Q4D2_9BACT|nr:2OG-Fe(II) oxygenase [Labilithrix luteola]AKV00599.1 hypothetical protein AKJ09_07262 [Labilithrix luteola]